jgi:hypothetical protein
MIYYILVVVLLILLIIAIIYYLNYQIEKFTEPQQLYPLITRPEYISVIQLYDKIRLYDIYIGYGEQYENPEVDDSIIAMYSSFTNATDTRFLNILNNSYTGSTLKFTPSTLLNKDYIFIDLPDDNKNNFLLSGIDITYDISNKSDNYIMNRETSNIFDIGTVNIKTDNPFANVQVIPMTVTIQPLTSETSNIVTYNYIPNTNISLYCNLFLITTRKILNSIYIKSIKLYFTPTTTAVEISKGSTTIDILSTRPTEQMPVILPITSIYEVTNDSETSCSTLEKNYQKLLRLKTPWAIYNPSKVSADNLSVLPDEYGRTIRNAIITGPGISKDKDNNIDYISGTTKTSILFPRGSFPKKNTICAIAKYNGTNKNKILTTQGGHGYDLGLDIGHNAGNSGIVTLYNKPISNRSSAILPSDWVVICFKYNNDEFKTLKKTIIINNEQVGNSQLDVDALGYFKDIIQPGLTDGQTVESYNTQYATEILYNKIINDYIPTDITKLPEGLLRRSEIDRLLPIQLRTADYGDLNYRHRNNYEYKLIINNLLNPRSCSDFSLAYLMIWHTVLLDNELLIVSEMLNNYIKNGVGGIQPTPLPAPSLPLSVSIKDGLSEITAAESAAYIKTLYPNSPNGRYWIKPAGATKAVQVYCIMDSACDGGGWMLAMKAAPGSSQFKYDSHHWTTNTELIPLIDKDLEAEGSLYMDTTTDAKYDIYNTYKATDCMAIFDSREFNPSIITTKCPISDSDIYTDPERKHYGWRWLRNNFNSATPITLLEFFASGKKDFLYTCRSQDTKEINDLQKYMRDNAVGGKYITYSDFQSDVIGNSSKRGASSPVPPYNSLIWSTQSEYLSYGFNVYCIKWNHKVRWGGTFNENAGSMPVSNDISGGIGMEYKDYSAGDGLGCCPATTGLNKSLSFKWFIR